MSIHGPSSFPAQERSLTAEEQATLDLYLADLRAFSIPGLEGRIQRGLDPAAMLAIQETRTLVDEICHKINIDIATVEQLTRELHVGAIWKKAKELKEGEKPEVKVWMLLANLCHEVNDKELSPRQSLEDAKRVKKGLTAAVANPEFSLKQATEQQIKEAESTFTEIDGVPFSESDAFSSMAIAGKTFGICHAGDVFLVGADTLDYSILSAEGLTSIMREERGRTVEVFQRNGEDVAKKRYPGLAIVIGEANRDLAFRLAKTAEK